MDTSEFLLTRQAIRDRMHRRRVEAMAYRASHTSSHTLPRLLQQGAYLFLGPNGKTNRLVGSLLWTLVPPLIIKLVTGRHQARRETLMQRVLRMVLPRPLSKVLGR